MSFNEQDSTKTQGMGRDFGASDNQLDVTKTQGMGRGEGDQQPGGNGVTTQCTSRRGTVIIRASVEHIGLAGDTEMTVNVKWPASSFCVPVCADTPTSGGQDSQTVRGTGNGPGSYILFEGNQNASAQQGAENKKGTAKENEKGTAKYSGTGAGQHAEPQKKKQ